MGREAWPRRNRRNRRTSTRPTGSAPLCVRGCSGYVVILAGLSALCSFIGMSLVGAGGFGGSVRTPLLSGFVAAAVGLIMSLVGVYILALIIDALAPTFGATRSRLNAFKVAAYGGTASMLAGVLSIVPALAPIGALASLYSIYLLYLGLPVLMKCPQDKTGGYTAVVLIAAIVVSVVMSAAAGIFHYGGASFPY